MAVTTATDWKTRTLQALGLRKKEVEPDVPASTYDAEKMLALAKRLSTKTIQGSTDNDLGGQFVVARSLSDQFTGIVPADQLEFVRTRATCTHEDPMMILFLLDTPEWNNPFNILTDFGMYVGWELENMVGQEEAFSAWKKQLLYVPL